MLHVISLGAGVQSTTMALMAAHGDILPMPDCAIFADTGHEPLAVYEHLDWLRSDNVLPFPVHIVSAGDLWASATNVKTTRDGKRSYIETAIPVFTKEGLRRGRGQRHCTRDFKIHPVNAKIRELAGLRRVTKKHGVIAEVWIGISQDEAMRRRDNEKPYLKSRWPLLEMKVTRDDCFSWMSRNGYPEPPRSACTFCPFRDDDSWRTLTPSEFRDAIAKEREIQLAYAAASQITSTPFFHEQRIPLSDVDLSGRANRQINMFNNECRGFCGV